MKTEEKAEVSKGSKANYQDVCKLKENINLPKSKTGSPKCHYYLKYKASKNVKDLLI